MTPPNRSKLCRQGCRRARPRPGLRIPVRGRRKTLQKIERIVARASPEEEVFYQDEVDVPLNPKIGSTYLKRGQQLLPPYSPNDDVIDRLCKQPPNDMATERG